MLMVVAMIMIKKMMTMVTKTSRRECIFSRWVESQTFLSTKKSGRDTNKGV